MASYLIGRSTNILKLEADTGVTMVQNGDTLLIGASGGGGGVSSLSVASANGLAGSSSGGTTPTLTLSTTVTGVLKGNGTAISAATVGTDYSVGTGSLATGILKSTTTSGALSIAVAGDFPTLNQNTTGSAAKWTTARLLAGNSVDGSAAVAFANKFIVQGTVDTGLSAAQFLGALATGLVKNTITTGVLSIGAAATDYVAPSAYASANGLTIATARLLGRTTASSGAAEEISIAGNLTLAAGVLTSPAYTGTANQVVVTGTVLSTPQDIATGSSPQFAKIGLGTAAVANHFVEASSSLNGVAVGLKQTNTSNGGTAYASIQLANDTGNLFAFFLNGSGNISYGGAQGVTFSQVGNFPMSFATQDTIRWGINGAGDWTFGTSAHIADSCGTPTFGTCGTSPVLTGGNDYAFRFVPGSGHGGSCVVNFGHTFANAPVILPTAAFAGSIESVWIISRTTSSVTFGFGSGNQSDVDVHVRGF